MPTRHNTKKTVFRSLPGSAQLRIFQLVCDSCPPDTPGTCWLAPVCKAWRGLARSVKGLRVVYQGGQQQQADSFCGWLRRHAPQVVALGITRGCGLQELKALRDAATAAAVAATDTGGTTAAAGGQAAGTAQAPLPPAAAAAAAAAAGTALPLRRLVIVNAHLLGAMPCQEVLQPLLAALPHLQHLHLPLTDPGGGYAMPLRYAWAASKAVATVLAPLQASTALTSLVLEGPELQGWVSDDAQAALLSTLPTTLRSLDWQKADVTDPQQLSFSHLTGLTHLRLGYGEQEVDSDGSSSPDTRPAEDAFTSLPQLRKLELLSGVPISDQGLLAVKQQLVGLELGEHSSTAVLDQLPHLQSLSVHCGRPGEVLQQAPAVRQLSVWLPAEEDPDHNDWEEPWQLQQYTGMSRLERLALRCADPKALPLGLCGLGQLKQLQLSFDACLEVQTAQLVSWAVALAGLVNLEVLTVPGMLTDCWKPWLTGLTRLVVLEVTHIGDVLDIPAAAAHINKLLAPSASSSSSRSPRSSSSSSSTQPCVQQHSGQVRVVCINTVSEEHAKLAEQLHKALVAALPVLPPGRHLFRGSWQQLQECGVELWPAPVAARLQQLVLQ